MHCGGGESHRTVCTRNDRFHPALPFRCTAQAPESEVRLYEGDRSLYSDCAATMYSIGHTINRQFIKLYDACYDTRIIPRPEGIQFAPYPVMSPGSARSFLTAEIYRRFNDTYGANQTYIPKRTLVINRGHLTASSDFLFDQQSRSTFKYVNAVPQFESINNGSWRLIENWVMSLRPMDSQLIVRTGAFGILQLRDDRNRLKPAYLLDDQRNPVPQWMYKRIITANRTSYVFLTHNNIFNEPPDHRFCNEVQCPNNLDLDRLPATGVTFCCDPTTFRVPANY
ncbi:hypothetical protein M5D96_004254 [Drosophila gunungcola]|uniref:DNA/RNA non-specific endonuclease/pyrophosphatase/phosphodiesterase domain-containing protein n=1 Tax=Drosophila gunungcola TaxID=103775 RepID=A0A9P9YTR9_9MUSC|nr:hypothetical protein M5D96_004254 [Drosophila gunungcola]